MAERISSGMADAINVTGDVKTIMTNSIIYIYSGTQPATADAAETGTLLMKLTVDGGVFNPGEGTNGLNMGTSSLGVLSKAAAETWKGFGEVAAGTGTLAGWFRWYNNAVVQGISTTAIRCDGSIGTSSTYDMQMSNPVIVDGVPATVNSFTYTTTKQ